VPVENNEVAPLANVGVKYLAANLPDLGQLPATRTSVNSASLSALTQAHNQGLRRSLKLLSQYSDLRIVTLMPTRFIEKPLNPAAFGFTNVISACLSGFAPVASQTVFVLG